MASKDLYGFEEDRPIEVAREGNNYLLVIGIDQYAHCPRLFNAVKDAQEIVQLLKKRFQFEEEHIIEHYDLDATKRNIYEAFRSMAERVTPKDNLIVYFSGHGEYDKLFNLGYWVPVNAEKEAVDQYVPNSEIRNILAAIKSHHTFLMVDSCFSGLLFAQNTSRNISLRKERDPSRWGLTAGRNEIVDDGTQGSNSPFAKSIIYQLTHTDKPLGVAELCDNVLEVVSANSSQTPRGEPLKVEGHQGGQFVFHLRKDEVADWKETNSAGTLVAYQTFAAKYPEGKFNLEAKSKIKSISAAALWQNIEEADEADTAALNEKLKLVNQYVDKYEDQPHYEEALGAGELLEYKHGFLQAKDSEYSLRLFLRKPTPNNSGAAAIKEEAEQILTDKNKAENDVRAAEELRKAAEDKQREEKRIIEEDHKKKQDEEDRRKKAEQEKQLEEKRIADEAHKKKQQDESDAKALKEKNRAEEERKKSQERLAEQKKKAEEESKSQPTVNKTVAQKSSTEPTFFEKNRKYLIPLLLLPFIIWGVIQMIPNNSNVAIDDPTSDIATTTTKVTGPLLFIWNKEGALTGDGWDAKRQAILDGVKPDEILEITGEYRADEVNLTTFDNLGIARANDVAGLFKPPLTNDRIRRKGKLVNAEESDKTSLFKSVAFRNIKNTYITPIKTQIKIGDLHQGGYVFQIDATGKHGLVCSKKDLGDFNWDAAIAECKASREGGYTDWYLPSKDELNLMYTKLHKNRLGGFGSGYYWSSTGVGTNFAWWQIFYNGNQGYNNKNVYNDVRAVRAF